MADMDLKGYNYAVNKEVSKFKPTDVSRSLKKIAGRESMKGLRDLRKHVTP